MVRMKLVLWCALLAAARACPLRPAGAGAQSPGDNFYRLLLNGDVERYAPGQRYVVTLVGSRTHDVVQQFTRFKVTLEPLDPAAPRAPSRQGQFQLFADTLTRFDEECVNSVVEADDLPKTEVQVMWKAPPAGSGCVLLKAMVYENESRWFAEDGQLTKRVCEDAAVSAPTCCACDDAKYKMVFEGLWSAQTHPKDFPVQALWLTHFSDIIGATHPANFSFWGEGLIATDGFRSLAEWGSIGLQERELRQQGKLLRSIIKAQGLWHPRVNSNTTAVFTVDRKRHLVSLASMFGPSPDWVVGVSGLDLCQKDCSWVESKVVDLFPYDAGTDNGISYMSPNSETVPRERMYRITPMYPEDPRAPFYNPGASEVPPMARLYLTREKLVPRSCDEDALLAQVVEEVETSPAAERPHSISVLLFYNPGASEVPPMARLYLTREKLVPRSCDEDALLAQVVEEVETSPAAERPECAVSEWSAWSPCSVACGKGLRMRTRQYRMPQKAQMFACDRQLVSKEMCVAAVAECEGDNATDNEEDLTLGAVEDQGICRTSEWGAWSECSVTCGVGVATRRRHFLDRMGPKKCPLVPIEENRKCMEPQCTEVEHDISDPSCPTSEWAAWSPCSASCGRGVAFRTRLLLVPPEQQARCSQAVELLQQRACSERDSCAVDALTAKLLHAPEQQYDEPRESCTRPSSSYDEPRESCTRPSSSYDEPRESCTRPSSSYDEPRESCTRPSSSYDEPRESCTRPSSSYDEPRESCTRLLLVPPEQQARCSQAVELLQQRACSEQDSCAVDALTAKRICMEEPQQGPCRGMYQRWAFVAAKGMCAPFHYGGCRGNRNNFLSQEDCLSTCSVAIGGGGPALAAAGSGQPGGAQAQNTINGPSLVQASDCQVSEWSDWSACSVSCGVGYQERTRTVLRAAGAGGAPCPPRLSRRRRCSRRC